MWGWNWLDGFHSPRDTLGSHHPLRGFLGEIGIRVNWSSCLQWSTCMSLPCLMKRLETSPPWPFPPSHLLLWCFPLPLINPVNNIRIPKNFQRGYQNQPFLRSSFLKGVTHFETELILKKGYFLELSAVFKKHWPVDLRCTYGNLMLYASIGCECEITPFSIIDPCGSQGYTHRKNKIF